MDGEIYYTTAIPWMKDKLTYLRQSFGPYQRAVSFLFHAIGRIP